VSAASIFVLGLGVVLVLPLVVRVARRTFDPFEPIVVFAVAYGVMFIARPVSMLAHGRLSYFGVDIRATLPLALLLALTGGVAFVWGYEVRAGRALARVLPAPREISTRAGVVGAACMIGLASIALVVLVWPAGGVRRLTILFHGQTYEVGQLVSARGSYPFLTAMLVVPAAVLLLALALRDRRRGLIVAAALVVVIALGLMIPLGARTYLLPLVGGCLTLAYVRRGTRPRPGTLVALALVAIIASYALITVREPGRRTHLTAYLRQFEERPGVALTPIIDGEDAEMAPVLAGALRVIPSRLHYRYGGAFFGSLAARPIPRQLWSAKPQPSGRQVVRVTWPELAKSGFSPEFSPLLVFYWDFGLAGVFAGMALFGMACRTLYEWFLRHRTNLAAQTIFAISLWLIVSGARNDPVDTIVIASFLVLPIVLLERCSSLRWPIVGSTVTRARVSQE
jgi:hypothetical protein